METTSLANNPFGLMMNPQAILEAVERSERLSRLERRICRPLDKPLIPLSDGARNADAEVDAEPDAEMLPEDFGAEIVTRA